MQKNLILTFVFIVVGLIYLYLAITTKTVINYIFSILLIIFGIMYLILYFKNRKKKK